MISFCSVALSFCILPVYLGAPYAFNKTGYYLSKKKKNCLLRHLDYLLLSCIICSLLSHPMFDVHFPNRSS
jgi:hypothetical protein